MQQSLAMLLLWLECNRSWLLLQYGFKKMNKLICVKMRRVGIL